VPGTVTGAVLEAINELFVDEADLRLQIAEGLVKAVDCIGSQTGGATSKKAC
jgi:hypothetical protein